MRLPAVQRLSSLLPKCDIGLGLVLSLLAHMLGEFTYLGKYNSRMSRYNHGHDVQSDVSCNLPQYPLSHVAYCCRVQSSGPWCSETSDAHNLNLATSRTELPLVDLHFEELSAR